MAALNVFSLAVRSNSRIITVADNLVLVTGGMIILMTVEPIIMTIITVGIMTGADNNLTVGITTVDNSNKVNNSNKIKTGAGEIIEANKITNKA